MEVSFKNTPEMRDDLLYDYWKKELQIWCMFTDLEKKHQVPAIFLTLKGKARETPSLDKLYVKKKVQVLSMRSRASEDLAKCPLKTLWLSLI